MIQEVIVSTQNASGATHHAPMGIQHQQQAIIIAPFRPSNTLDNIIESESAIINYCDDVRIFVGCLNGKQHWKLNKAAKIDGHYLTAALAHEELRLSKIEDDVTRPKLFCRVVHSVNHAPFKGFNRAQHAVLEAAILVSRLHLLPLAKIEAELDYLKIGLEKTGGENEHQAWTWLMERIKQHQQQGQQHD